MTELDYEYVGGGWFRQRGVPKGETADMLHGDHAIERYQQALCGAAFDVGHLTGRWAWMTRHDVLSTLTSNYATRTRRG